MSDLRFNVAQLLQEHVGAIRDLEFEEPTLNLGEGLSMKAIVGEVRLIRTKNGVLTQAQAEGSIEVMCVRCLERFAQSVSVEFDEEYHATVHATSGVPLPDPEEDDVFRINSAHLLDLGDAIREYALLALPIAPICREDCQGLIEPTSSDDDSDVDDRLAALKQLLK